MAFDQDLEEIVAELGRIRQIPKCTSCECFLGIVQALQFDLSDTHSREVEVAAVTVREWLQEGVQVIHPCLGCEDCLPTKPYVRFSALWKEIAGATTTNEEI